MNHRNLTLAACLVIPTAAQTLPDWQTAAGGKTAFDVASIKPSNPAKFAPPLFPLDAGDAFNSTGGRFFADFNIAVYVMFAYKLTLTPQQMQSMMAGLPKWWPQIVSLSNLAPMAIPRRTRCA